MAAGNSSANGNFITALSHFRGAHEEQLAQRVAAIFNKALIAVFPLLEVSHRASGRVEVIPETQALKDQVAQQGKNVEIQ